MRTLIIYDSAFGNTAKIAKAMADQSRLKGTYNAVFVGDVRDDDIRRAHFLVIGSPTQGGQPTQKIKEFLNSLSPEDLKNKQVAAFDTRFAMSEHGVGLKLVMKTIGFAAPKIQYRLQANGARIMAEPVGFIVSDTEGPLLDGELVRASQWVRNLIDSIQD